jgi:hypothetical protein
MARDPAELRPPSHATMDADVAKSPDLEQSHSLPNSPAEDSLDSRSLSNGHAEESAPSHSLTNSPKAAADEDGGLGRRRSPLSVCSAPAHLLEHFRPRPAERPSRENLLRVLSEDHSSRSPRVVRHSCAPLPGQQPACGPHPVVECALLCSCFSLLPIPRFHSPTCSCPMAPC